MLTPERARANFIETLHAAGCQYLPNSGPEWVCTIPAGNNVMPYGIGGLIFDFWANTPANVDLWAERRTYSGTISRDHLYLPNYTGTCDVEVVTTNSGACPSVWDYWTGYMMGNVTSVIGMTIITKA
jgi:hypothetical protein